jgi:hypothetical protein
MLSPMVRHVMCVGPQELIFPNLKVRSIKVHLQKLTARSIPFDIIPHLGKKNMVLANYLAKEIK